MPLVTDPTTIVITPSTTPGVTHYVLQFQAADGTHAPAPYNAGNPPPDAEGLLRVAMADARQGDPATGPFTLTATAYAGDLASDASAPSEPFSFTPPPEPELPDAPEIALEGGTVEEP